MFKINPWKLERMKRNFNESFSFTYLFLAIQAAAVYRNDACRW